MQGFLLKLLVAAVKNPDVQAFLFKLMERLAVVLLPQLAAVIPAAVAAGIKGLGDLIPDIHVPGLGDLEKVVSDGVNALLPDDVDIPILSDAVKGLTGFDLTDWLKTL